MWYPGRRRCTGNDSWRSRNPVRSWSSRNHCRRSPRCSGRITRALIYRSRCHWKLRWTRCHRLQLHRMLLRLAHGFRHLVPRQRHRLLQCHLHRRSGIHIEMTRTGEQRDRRDRPRSSTDRRANDGIFAFAAHNRRAGSDAAKLWRSTSGRKVRRNRGVRLTYRMADQCSQSSARHGKDERTCPAL